jgi:hypothetical protein
MGLTYGKGSSKNKMMKIILSSDQDKFFQTSAAIENLSSQQRLSNAFKKFFLFFSLAIASLFIPVFHFFLVPLFLILSLVFATKSYSIKMRISPQEKMLCFICQENIAKPYQLNSEMRLACSYCSAHYLLRP